MNSIDRSFCWFRREVHLDIHGITILSVYFVFCAVASARASESQNFLDLSEYGSTVLGSGLWRLALATKLTRSVYVFLVLAPLSVPTFPCL
jgi:hypothetical protein